MKMKVKLNSKLYLVFWLILLPVVIAGGTYWGTTPKSPVYLARTVYTVVPQSALAKGDYQDMQAANLFIDVIKSWLTSDNLQAEMQSKLAAAKFRDLRPLSMQTFAVAVTAPELDQALRGSNLVREIIYRELGRYAKSGNAGHVIYNFDPMAKQVFPRAYANAGLGLLVGLILGGFVVLIERYYRNN